MTHKSIQGFIILLRNKYFFSKNKTYNYVDDPYQKGCGTLFLGFVVAFFLSSISVFLIGSLYLIYLIAAILIWYSINTLIIWMRNVDEKKLRDSEAEKERALQNKIELERKQQEYEIENRKKIEELLILEEKRRQFEESVRNSEIQKRIKIENEKRQYNSHGEEYDNEKLPSYIARFQKKGQDNDMH